MRAASQRQQQNALEKIETNMQVIIYYGKVKKW